MFAMYGDPNLVKEGHVGPEFRVDRRPHLRAYNQLSVSDLRRSVVVNISDAALECDAYSFLLGLTSFLTHMWLCTSCQL